MLDEGVDDINFHVGDHFLVLLHVLHLKDLLKGFTLGSLDSAMVLVQLLLVKVKSDSFKGSFHHWQKPNGVFLRYFGFFGLFETLW